MFRARWQIDAKFGEKSKVIDLMRKWEAEIGPHVGLDDMKFGLLTGSIGTREATVEAEHTVESLAQLEAFFAKLGKNDAHAVWGKDLGAHVVSGSSYWSILRIL
ncbi:MAG: hypothetical protein ABIV25_09860 [Paracoccaceae bacterium]